MPNFTLQPQDKKGRHYLERLAPGVELDMVLIPGGRFMMGSPENEPERRLNEGPQHPVTVPTFFMGRYPITQAQYEAIMGMNPATNYDADRFVHPKKPVVGVSWNDAVEFCRRLSDQTDREYRLPSEAEWEYACRAGTTTPFYFGRILTTDLANYNGNHTYNGSPEGEYRNAMTAVDHFEYANAFGLHDMHGNVREWCLDHWHDNYEGAPNDGSAWLTGNARRVLRGGSWGNPPKYCRSAVRYSPVVDRDIIFGFRVVSVASRILL